MDTERQYFQLHKANYEKIINRLGAFTGDSLFTLNIAPSLDKNRQIYLLHKTAYDEILKRLDKINGSILMGAPGEPGKDGITPTKGVDYFTDEEKESFIASILSQIPAPIPGKPGKNAKPVDYSKVEKMIDEKLASFTVEKPEKIDVQALLEDLKTAIPKPVPVDYKSLRKYIKEEIETIENNRESRVRMLHSAGPSTRLEELTNVAKNFSNGDLLSYQDGKFVPVTQSQGGGYSVETPVGSVNSSNTSFTVTATPVYIVSDGVTYFENAGYTLSGLTVTMDLPPTQFIRSFYNI